MSPARRPVAATELMAALSVVRDWLAGRADEPPRADLAAAVRASVRTLAQDAPGHTVELRVPPFVAVQCVAGPRHTRGTPPNVVQTDARTWLELAVGMLSWDDALSTGRVSASGSRADLSALLPIAHHDAR